MNRIMAAATVGLFLPVTDSRPCPGGIARRVPTKKRSANNSHSQNLTTGVHPIAGPVPFSAISLGQPIRNCQSGDVGVIRGVTRDPREPTS